MGGAVIIAGIKSDDGLMCSISARNPSGEVCAHGNILLVNKLVTRMLLGYLSCELSSNDKSIYVTKRVISDFILLITLFQRPVLGFLY